MTRRALVAALLVLATVASAFVAVTTVLGTPERAEAANAADFDPGMLISDALFYDGGALTAASVQSFIASKETGCKPGATCLKNYTVSTPSMPAVAGKCAAYQGVANESAASIIYKVGAACNISQAALIVILEKEQSLVTAIAPGAGAYAAATGFGCPDTGNGCDQGSTGFFAQVYNAGLQFQLYAASPTRYNYRAGQNNSILYAPGCTSSTVFIQNKATAGLYDYTPYQPNADALANLYGSSGNPCSSYGNRNFWRIYSDWFGDPRLGSSLVRTAASPTVFVLSGTTKYPIADVNIFNALYPLGGVGYVTQSFLDSYTTGPTMGRVIRSSSGQVYYFDVGAKFQFMSCDDVAAYGVACGDSILLTDAQINALRTSVNMTTTFTTTDGKQFLISGGRRSEVLDAAALASVAHQPPMIPLYEAGISNLPYAAPVMDPSPVVVQSRTDGSLSLYDGSALSAVSPALLAQSPLGTRFSATYPLDAGSIAALPRAAAFTGFMTDGSGASYVLSGTGRVKVSPSAFSGAAFTQTSATILAALPVVGDASGSSLFVMGASSPSIYLLDSGSLRKVMVWDVINEYVAKGVSSTIWSLPDAVLAQLPLGSPLMPSGELVKGSSVKVYVTDGAQLLPLPSFDISIALGLGASVTTVSDAVISGLAAGPTLSTVGVLCGSAPYVGIGGGVAPITDETLVGAYGIPFLALSDPATCAAMPKSVPALTRFLRNAAGKIYYIQGGQKHPIQSWDRLIQLGGVDQWVQSSDQLLNQIPTGSDA